MDNNEKLDIIIAKLDEALKIDNEKEMIAIRVTTYICMIFFL